jgi:hypothetical protein
VLALGVTYVIYASPLSNSIDVPEMLSKVKSAEAEREAVVGGTVQAEAEEEGRDRGTRKA